MLVSFSLSRVVNVRMKFQLLCLIKIQVHMSAPNVEWFINMLMTIPSEGYGTSFVYVMSEWTKLQGKYSLSFRPALCWR